MAVNSSLSKLLSTLLQVSNGPDSQHSGACEFFSMTLPLPFQVLFVFGLHYLLYSGHLLPTSSGPLRYSTSTSHL